MKAVGMLIVALVFVLPAHSEEFYAGTANWQPYAYVSETGELAGISVDVVRALSVLTGHRIIIKLYPAKRLNIMFDQNKLDMNFADSPLWNKKSAAPNYIFTKSYTAVKECVYFHKDTYNHATHIADLWGKKIGIVLGYYYPMLETAFQEGRIRKVNIPNENALIMLLNRKQVDAAIFDTRLFDYLVEKKNYSGEDFTQSLQLSNAPLCIKLRIEKKGYIQEFNNALIEIKTNGTLERILSHY